MRGCLSFPLPFVVHKGCFCLCYARYFYLLFSLSFSFFRTFIRYDFVSLFSFVSLLYGLASLFLFPFLAFSYHTSPLLISSRLASSAFSCLLLCSSLFSSLLFFSFSLSLTFLPFYSNLLNYFRNGSRHVTDQIISVGLIRTNQVGQVVGGGRASCLSEQVERWREGASWPRGREDVHF